MVARHFNPCSLKFADSSSLKTVHHQSPTRQFIDWKLLVFEIYLHLQQKHSGWVSERLIWNRGLYSVNSIVLWFDLMTLFYPPWPIFRLDLKIIKTNIMTAFQNNLIQVRASSVFTMFLFDFTQWPSFWRHMIHIWLWPEDHQDKNFDRVSERLGQSVCKRFFFYLTVFTHYPFFTSTWR